MKRRTKHKILGTLCVWLVLIVAGTLEYLPFFFFDTELGRSHSIFAPIAALLDLGFYAVSSLVIVAMIVDIYDQYKAKSN